MMSSRENVAALMKFMDSKRKSLRNSFLTMHFAWTDFEAHFDSSEKAIVEAAHELQAREDALYWRRKSVADREEEFEMMRKAMESRLDEVERREAQFDLFRREQIEYLRTREERLEARVSDVPKEETMESEAEKCRELSDYLDLKERVLNDHTKSLHLLQNLNEELRMALEFKGKQFEELELHNQRLELQLAEQSKELQEKEEIEPSIQPTRTPWDSFEPGTVPDLFRLSSDPARLLLDSMQCCFLSILKDDSINGNNTMVVFLPLLKELVKSRVEIGIHNNIKSEAQKFAADWKENLQCPKSQEAFCFLLFLSIYKLGPWFNPEELVHLLCECNNDLSGYLLREFGLEQIMVEHIHKLVTEKQQQLKVVGYIYDFGLVSKFTPVSILKDYHSSATAAAKELYNRDDNAESKAKAMEDELIVVQEVIKCIVDRGLESLFPTKPLRRRAKELLKKMGRRENHSKHSPSPYDLKKQPEKPSEAQSKDLFQKEDLRVKKECCDGSSS